MLCPRERDPILILEETGWTPGPVWTGAENFNPTANRSPDSPARSKSLHQLRYPGPIINIKQAILSDMFMSVYLL